MKSVKAAIVAAMEREVAPLVKEWTSRKMEYRGREFRFHESDSVVVVCGGIGAEAARRASEAVIALYSPQLLISAGFAGGLDSSLTAGDLFCPASVIDASDGSRNQIAGGKGVLISLRQIASPEQKSKLAAAYGAQAVDMEAAAAGRSAQLHGVEFRAVKAVSDTAEQDLPPMDAFIRNGRFLTGKFVVHAMLRPWLWASVMRLSRSATRATKALCSELSKYGDSINSTRVGTLREAGVREVK